MKKEDLTGLLVYALLLASAIIFAFTVMKDFSGRSGFETGPFIAFMLGAIATGVVLNAIFGEIGHVIGAKIGGYAILGVNILGFNFSKVDNKVKFNFKGYDGLTGETRIYPNKKNDEKEPNPVPYSLFPSVMLAVLITLSIVLFITFNNIADGNSTLPIARMGYFLLVVAYIGMMIFVYNIVPLKLDTMNDGYRLRLVINPKNREAFNELLKVKKAIETGDKNVEIKTFDTITNFTADLNFNKVYLLLDEGKLEEAKVLIKQVVENKDDISEKTYIRAKAQLIYINIMLESIEEAEKYYTDEVPVAERRLISKDISMASVRAYMLMSGILDKSLSETEIALNHVMRAFKKTPKNRQTTELKLYNNALKRVIEAHPNWNLEGYLLEEK